MDDKRKSDGDFGKMLREEAAWDELMVTMYRILWEEKVSDLIIGAGTQQTTQI